MLHVELHKVILSVIIHRRVYNAVEIPCKKKGLNLYTFFVSIFAALLIFTILIFLLSSFRFNQIILILDGIFIKTSQ